MPSSFPTPERCLLVQAARWFVDNKTMPIPDKDYRRAPGELNADNSQLRDLFSALQCAHCDLRGELVAKCSDLPKPYESKDPNRSRNELLRRYASIDILYRLFNFHDIDFINSRIKITSRIDDKNLREQVEKRQDSYAVNIFWEEEYIFQHVTVDFEKLRNYLSTANELTQQTARRSVLPSESADDTKVAKTKSQPEQLTKPALTRGRPPKWDWEAILTEIILLANEPDGLPESQADLEKWVADRFVELCGDHPVASHIRKKVGPIYQRIRSKSQ